MSLPIRLILWAGNDPNHHDHLHVEGDPKQTGTPPYSNPGKTASVQTVYDALVAEFGPTKYFTDPGTANWTHMGWYNRRKIANTDIWSQHAWANALDIGPYNGVAAQQRFYDFLTQEDDEMSSPKNWDADDIKAWRSMFNNTLIEGTDSNFDFHVRNTYALVVQIRDMISNVTGADLDAIAQAVNDEQDKRARERLGSG